MEEIRCFHLETPCISISFPSGNDIRIFFPNYASIHVSCIFQEILFYLTSRGKKHISEWPTVLRDKHDVAEALVSRTVVLVQTALYRWHGCSSDSVRKKEGVKNNNSIEIILPKEETLYPEKDDFEN